MTFNSKKTPLANPYSSARWLALGAMSAVCLLDWRLAAADTSGEESEILRDAKQGITVQVPGILAHRHQMPRIPLDISVLPGPQFLFSDKPEYFVSGNGLALQETVTPGTVRLYLYHVPEPAGSQKTISAVIENLGDKTMTLRLLRRALPSPGAAYHRIGKSGLIDFFNSHPQNTARTIAPGSGTPLDPQLDATIVSSPQLVHGIYEFEIDQPARVTVLQRDPEQHSEDVIHQLPKLPQVLPEKPTGNGAGRGIFPTSNLSASPPPDFTLDTSNGPVQLIVADGRTDRWIRGHDSIDGKESENVGNYGVLYRIRLNRASSDGRSVALLMSKIATHGGGCARMSCAVKVSEGAWPGGVVAVPGDQHSIGAPNEAVVIQKFHPLPEGEQDTIEILYSPPGASCLPTPFLFVPY